MFALIGSTALWLLYAWLLGAIAASFISGRKGYGEKAGLATGMLLSLIAPVIWLLVPARAGSAWKTQGMIPKRRTREVRAIGGSAPAAATTAAVASAPAAAAGAGTGGTSTAATGGERPLAPAAPASPAASAAPPAPAHAPAELPGTPAEQEQAPDVPREPGRWEPAPVPGEQPPPAAPAAPAAPEPEPEAAPEPEQTAAPEPEQAATPEPEQAVEPEPEPEPEPAPEPEGGRVSTTPLPDDPAQAPRRAAALRRRPGAVVRAPASVQSQGTHPAAIAALVLALLFGNVFAVIAGYLALAAIEESGGRRGGERIARLAITLGYIETAVIIGALLVAAFI